MNPIWQNWQFTVKPLWSVDLITTISWSPSTRLLYNKGAKPPARKTVNSRQLSLWRKKEKKRRRLPCLLFLAIPIQDIPSRSHLSAFLIAVPQPRTASGYRMERHSYGRSHKELVKAPVSAAYSLTCFRVNHLVLSKATWNGVCLHASSTKPSLTLCVFLKAQKKNKLKIIPRVRISFLFSISHENLLHVIVWSFADESTALWCQASQESDRYWTPSIGRTCVRLMHGIERGDLSVT